MEEASKLQARLKELKQSKEAAIEAKAMLEDELQSLKHKALLLSMCLCVLYAHECVCTCLCTILLLHVSVTKRITVMLYHRCGSGGECFTKGTS